MREFLAGVITLGTAVVAASIVYQIVKPGSSGSTITGQAFSTIANVSGDLFK